MNAPIREADVEARLSMERVLATLEPAFRDWGRGRAVNHPRRRIRVPEGFLHVMEAAWIEAGVMGLKAYATVSGGRSFLVQLFDTASGELLATIEASRLGQLRTGAASGLAARYLAREDASTVGLIGTGYQAETQLEAVCAVRPIERIRAYSRTPSSRERFAAAMTDRLNRPVEPVDDAETAVRGADIVITITSAREPVLQGAWISEGACVLAAGANHALRRELDTEAVRRADLIVADDLAQARDECGDLLSAVERGAVRWEAMRELRQVVAGDVAGRPSEASIALFESQGVALEDVAAAYELLPSVQTGSGDRGRAQ